jgi:hypothetical protein
VLQALLQEEDMSGRGEQGAPIISCQPRLDLDALAHSSGSNAGVSSAESAVDSCDDGGLAGLGSTLASQQICEDKLRPQYFSVGKNLLLNDVQVFERVEEEGGVQADDSEVTDGHQDEEEETQNTESEEGLFAWHEVTAKPFLDPVSGRWVVAGMKLQPSRF